MPEPSPSYFHHLNVTLFPKSSNNLTFCFNPGNKPQQPASKPNIPQNSIQNTNMQIRPM